MIKIGSNAVKEKDFSYIKIEPIVRHHHHNCRENKNNKSNDSSSLKSSSSVEKAGEEQQKRRRRDVKHAFERLETKMDQKFRNFATEMSQKNDQLGIEMTKIKETLDELKQFRIVFIDYLINRNKRRDRSRSDSRSRSSRSRSSRNSKRRRRVSRSSSRSQESNYHRTHHEQRSRQRDREEPNHRDHEQRSRSHHRNHGEKSRSNLIDTETIARLRVQHPTPTAFAANLMLKLFTWDEMTVKNVNVEGRTANRSKEPAVALSPTRVAELKRHCLDNVAIDERETMWIECRSACNRKLTVLKEKKQ